jgi:hypothetical protein
MQKHQRAAEEARRAAASSPALPCRAGSNRDERKLQKREDEWTEQEAEGEIEALVARKRALLASLSLPLASLSQPGRSVPLESHTPLSPHTHTHTQITHTHAGRKSSSKPPVGILRRPHAIVERVGLEEEEDMSDSAGEH